MGGAVNQLTAVENPQGPLIRQAKIVVTRRLSNVIMVRGGLYTYEKEDMLDAFLICETYEDGFWKHVGHHHCMKENTDTLETYFPFQCKPATFFRLRGFYMVNNSAKIGSPNQRILVQALGIWNIWGRDDGYDEPKTTPLDLFYDNIPLPDISERKYQRHEKVEIVETYEPLKSYMPLPEMFVHPNFDWAEFRREQALKKKKRRSSKKNQYEEEEEIDRDNYVW